jgi:predicted site-specific integrase-resolvase
VQLQTSIDASKSDSDQEDLEDQMVDLENAILQAEYDKTVNIRVPLNDEEKGKWKTNKKACDERVQKHLLNQQKAFAIIIS